MRLLILGTGGMAKVHAAAFSKIDGVTLAGCVDIDPDRAQAFAETHEITQTFDSLEAALATGGFGAMANVTPDAVHCETTLRALAAGLHVFCEKPLATNHNDARRMTDAAAQAGLIGGVNLTYRNVAALQKARQIIEQGTLGALRHFEASYLQSWLTQPAWGDWKTEHQWLWRLSRDHGSMGVLGDVGIHIFDFASFAADAVINEVSGHLATFDKASGGQIGDYRLDANDSMVVAVRFSNGALGTIHASRFASGHLNDLKLSLFGTDGGLEITNQGNLGTLRLCRGDDLQNATWNDVPLGPVTTTYECFANAVMHGASMTPDFATATQLQAVIDAVARSNDSGARENI